MAGWDEDFQLTDETVQRLIDLLRDDAPVGFIAQGLKFHYVHPSLVHYFSAPILSWEPNMETSLHWIGATVRVERLETIIVEHRAGIVGQLATPAEVMVHLFPAAKDRLLHQDWTVIYGYVAFTTLSRHNLLSEKTAILHHYQNCELTLTEQERLVTLRRDIRQAVVRLARRREIAWPGQPISAPALNQTSFRQLAERQGKARSVLKLPGEKNDNAKEEETKKSSPVTPGALL